MLPLFGAPVLQISLVPPAHPVAPVPTVQSAQHAIIAGGIEANPRVPGEIMVASSLDQAKELNTDLWFTFVAITLGLTIGVVAGGRR